MSTNNTASFDPSLATVAGVITYWSGSSGVRVSELDAALKARGLDLAPGLPSAEVRVRRAVEAALPKGHIARQSPKGGRSIVRERKVEGRLVYDELARAHWDLGTKQLCVEVYETADEGAAALATAVAAEVRQRFVEDADILAAADLLNWLTDRVLDTCQAVSLRRMGGVYFVPRSMAPLWQKIRDAVHETGHGTHVWEIPAMDGAEAALAVLDALLCEAATSVATIEREIESGTLQRRALDTRTSRLEELIEKLGHYAETLGLDVAQAVETATRAQANVVIAINALGAEERARVEE